MIRTGQLSADPALMAARAAEEKLSVRDDDQLDAVVERLTRR